MSDEPTTKAEAPIARLVFNEYLESVHDCPVTGETIVITTKRMRKTT